MKTYVITVFAKSGETLFEENFEATDDQMAREKGEVVLEENGFDNTTYRITSSSGKLIGFHR